MWSKMENRTIKNVSAPAAVIDEKIYIIGGMFATWVKIITSMEFDHDNISPLDRIHQKSDRL